MVLSWNKLRQSIKKLGKKIGNGRLPFANSKDGNAAAIEVVRTSLSILHK